MTLTSASLFTGGGLADIGLMAAGYTPIWGVEWEAPIAACAQLNMPDCKIHVADVRSVPFEALERPDHLHVSPACTNASVANAQGGESRTDMEAAQAICRTLRILRPRTFTLENVYGYRKFDSYREINATLYELGYARDKQHCNAADFGVPQTRRRLILRATLNGDLRPLPVAVPWNGWYAAIEDILHTLPPSQFAPWQLMRLPAEFTDNFLHMTSNTQKANPTGTGVLARTCPANTVTGGDGTRPRAFLVDCVARTGADMTTRQSSEPAHTITATHGRRPANESRAWISRGRVVAMTPRALLRFQSGPDWYCLPENKRLACTVIGNGVPCLMMERIGESLK